MVVTRNPWICRNEYHTIFSPHSGIIFYMEIVEVKDKPHQAPTKPHIELGKMVGLFLRLTKSLRNTSIIVVMENGFCVLKITTELEKFFILSSYLIKNCHYWPKYTKGAYIKYKSKEKPPG